MMMGRVREIIKAIPNVQIDVLGPEPSQLVTLPSVVNPDIFTSLVPQYTHKRNGARYIPIYIMPNALATRYDFNMREYAQALNHVGMQNYDLVYVNDPMQLRNLKALFHVYWKYQPKFVVHNHFIDNPSAPKFPLDASLWLGQVEASVKADINFWQCQSALDIYKEEAKSTLSPELLKIAVDKSFAWDDGYSSTEVNTPVDVNKLRFDTTDFMTKSSGKTVIFVPNRIGGHGRSSDYTNCGKFLFDILPALHKRDPNIMVIAGNPSQKFSNRELQDDLGQYGFVSLVPDSLRRDEYLWIAKHSDLALGLYDQDSYGGTAARECIDLGCLPVWLDNYEYASIANEWWPGDYAGETPSPCLAKTDFSDLVDVISNMINIDKSLDADNRMRSSLVEIVRRRCSYETTTPIALARMKLVR